MTQIDNIKNLYNSIADKDDFLEKVALEFDIQKSSARSNWFSRYEFPTRHKVKENLIEFMQNYIRINGERSSK